MKHLLIVSIFIVFNLLSYGQDTTKKIKVILLGTFHFNQSLDSSSRLHSDLFSDKRQKEIAVIVNKLAAQKPDKIFLEFTAKDQLYYDSIYKDYLEGKEPQRQKTKANEIFQLGMRTAKMTGLKEVIGMNYQPEELPDTAYHPANGIDSIIKSLYMAFEKFDDTLRANETFYDLPYPFTLPRQDSLLQKSTLSEFLIFLNSKQKLQRDEYTNWNFFYSVGAGMNMSLTDYVGTFWYGTNVRNYNNVLRNTDFGKDRCYLIIYGSSHIAFLRYLFEQNPYFEVIDAEAVLH